MKHMYLVLLVLLLEHSVVNGLNALVEDVARPSDAVEISERKLLENPDFGVLEVCSNGACSTEVPCSRLGVKRLLYGGNAMDSAVTAAICVGITNSFSSGIGGGGFILVKNVDGVFDTIDFRETAPKDLSVEHLSGQMYRTSLRGLAVGVPGEIRGLYEAHKKYGKLPWRELFPENIEIAKGFFASNQLVKRINKLKEHVMMDPGLRATYTRNNELIKEGDMVVRENYAKTLEMIMNDPEGFYSGELGDMIVKAVRDKGGIISRGDMMGYKVMHRSLLEGKYHDYKVYTTTLPTSAPLILEALNILEKYELKKLEMKSLKSRKFKHFHLLIEVFKFVMARRGELSDPGFSPGWERIVEDITSRKTADDIYKKISLDSVLDPSEYGMKKKMTEDYGTTHINVVDKDDKVVLSTINLEFGAKFMDPEIGIIFNNQIDDFYVPDAISDPQTPANIMEAGKKPFSSASPVLLMMMRSLHWVVLEE